MKLPRSSLALVLVAACVTPAGVPGNGASSRSPVDDVVDSSEAIRFAIGKVDPTLPDVDAIGYDVDLRVDTTPRSERYAADVRGTFVATRDLTELALDFEGNTVEAVTVDGAAASHRREGSTLVVTLPTPVARGEAIHTRIRIQGPLFQAGGVNPNDFRSFGGFMVKQQNAEGRRIFTTLSWPEKARRWLPLRDHPRDGAMVAFRVTFPRTFTVVANGTPVGEEDRADGMRTTRFEALTAMPTYAFHVAAYEGWSVTEYGSAEPKVRAYAYPRSAGVVSSVYADVPRARDELATRYGPYRFGPLSFLEEPIFGGGMEHATVVSMDETLFSRPAQARSTAIHELAHHWSGDLVRIRTWNDFWLSEGVTEYLTAKAIGAVDGPDEERATFRGYLADALAADQRAPHALRPPDPEIDVLTIFDPISYQKGACVMRQLERVVGTDALTTFLRGWFARHAFEAVTTADFEAELAAETGMDLAPFFRDFVRTAGHPELAVDVSPTGNGTEIELRVTQAQVSGPAGGYRMPLDVELVDAAGAKTRVAFDLDARTTTKKVNVGFVPARIVADPDEWVVGTVTPR